MTNPDNKYMLMALKLAKRGIASVEPNPAVGCIIVKADKIIATGFHKKFGAPHAEINTLEDCTNNGISPKGATMYVTLEPCCHHGKTPPCTDAIIQAGLAKVVIATLDPSEKVNGQGAEQLRNASIEVQTGLFQSEARLLNAPFIKFAETNRCWVVIKWAQSIDGKVSWSQSASQPPKHPNRWLSNDKSRKDLHKLRCRVQAILVGIDTVLTDDPLLTARPAKGRTPLRIVLDSYLRIPLNSQLLATAKKVPVLIVTSRQAIDEKQELTKKISEKGAEILALPATQGRCDINLLLDELSRRRIIQLLVEGGPTVISSFLRENLADEIRIYITPKILGANGGVDISKSLALLPETICLEHVDIKNFDSDIRLTGLSKTAAEKIAVT